MPPKMIDFSENIRSLDFSHDKLVTIDPKIVILATQIQKYITTVEMTDSVQDQFMHITDNWTDHSHMTLADYIDVVLNTFFTYSGRVHYDAIKNIIENFQKSE